MLPKIFLGIGVFAAFFAVLIFSGKLPGVGKKEVKPQGDIVIWGTLPDTMMLPIVQKFNPGEAKTYRISYREINENDFDRILVESLANGAGPDLIIAPYQTMLAQISRVSPFPVKSLNEKKFKDSYVDGASDVFWSPSGAIALPVSIDPLVLFYNRTLFSRHLVVNPPKDWAEVVEDVIKLTVVNEKNEFLESGIALGSPVTPYAKDIIMAIVAQQGQLPVLKQTGSNGSIYTVTANRPTTPKSPVYPLTTALRYFTQFADPAQQAYTWNQYSKDASEAFVSEKVAMYIGFSSELRSLRARNPRAQFEMANFPQTQDSKGVMSNVTGMRMHGIARLRSSRNPDAALAAQVALAGGTWSLAISSVLGGVPASRVYASTSGLSSVILNGMLTARGWQDKFRSKSEAYVTTMISDSLNNRATVTDAANMFVTRMQDLYTPLK